MPRLYIEPEQKALEINLNECVYGSFAEIGAGQEVARYFFQAGSASGTIAKTMSAYDKTVSDRIYGAEEKGRYVCESRLYKMLDHEYELMVDRLTDERPDSTFFAFADTVSAINYHRTIKGSGWLGLRYQLEPQGEPHDLVLHLKMLDNDNKLQQQAVGILGVNLIYACYNYSKNPEELILSLMDNLWGRVHIDMLRLEGPAFKRLDNRLVSLWLVKHHMTDVVMFGPEGKPLHASEYLYKKSALIVRGSWRPPTLVNMDMLLCATNQFKAEPDVEANKAKVLCEITLDNLRANGEIDEQDYLDRVKLLGHLGQTVVVSASDKYPKLVSYFEDYRLPKLGLVVGVKSLLELISDRYEKSKDSKLLSAFGEVFRKDVKMYAYPCLQDGSDELMTAQNAPVPEGVKFIYQHLLDDGEVVGLEGYRTDIMHIYSPDVLQLLRADEEGWKSLVTPQVAELISNGCLFGFPCQRIVFEY